MPRVVRTARHCRVASIFILLCGAQAAAQQVAPSDSLPELFHALSGRWSGAGGFARGGVISLGMAGTQANYAAIPVSFASASWSATGVTLVADSVPGSTATPNRFSYQLFGRDSLKMRWEVFRSAAWSIGDSLLCGRA